MKISFLLHNVPFLFVIIFLSSCRSINKEQLDFHIIADYSLPKVLTETSGLACSTENQAFTINDSGNKPIVYTFNEQGQVINQQQLPIKNYDWEAIATTNNHMFIGDIGNNSGKRAFVQIHMLTSESKPKFIKTIDVNYQQNNLNNNQYMAHDYDAESIIVANDKVYLLSKSWQSKQLFIYQVPIEGSKHNLTPSWTVKGLPGVITGGDFDKLNQRFVLVGYELKTLGWFNPFIAILDDDFNLVKTFQLNQYSQVEGLCINPNGEVWITQEGSYFSGQKLIKLQIK